ncbi:MAG: biopolymer transporter ExbD [candidate division WOR-3 bacterium]
MTQNRTIDILPMACVGLLLVVMMIMTAPMVMTHSNTPVAVPQTHTAERKTEEDIVITLTADYKLYLNDQPINKLDLEDKLDELLIKDPYCLVVVRADKDVLHKDVLELIAIAKQAGAQRLACATKKIR